MIVGSVVEIILDGRTHSTTTDVRRAVKTRQ